MFQDMPKPVGGSSGSEGATLVYDSTINSQQLDFTSTKNSTVYAATSRDTCKYKVNNGEWTSFTLVGFTISNLGTFIAEFPVNVGDTFSFKYTDSGNVDRGLLVVY